MLERSAYNNKKLRGEQRFLISVSSRLSGLLIKWTMLDLVNTFTTTTTRTPLSATQHPLLYIKCLTFTLIRKEHWAFLLFQKGFTFFQNLKKKKIHARVNVNWTMQKSAKKRKLALSVMVNSSEGRNSEALSVSAGLSACSPSLSQKCDF